MKIGILSRDAELYSTRRLCEAGEALGHEVRVIDYLRCYMNVNAEDPTVMLKGENLKFDAIIPRIGASHSFYGTAVVQQFEMMGVYPLNHAAAISRSRDKLRSLQILAKRGIGLPVTGFANSTKDIEGLIESVGGAPLIVKLLEGTQGIGVVLAETKQAAGSVIAAFRGLKANILIQEYLSEANGKDIRAFVVGGKVIAAMERQAPPGEFRTNLHRGGKVSKVKLTAQERHMAVRASKILGLNVSGVDLIRSNHGPVVLEVNSSPGLEGIEEASGVDVAKKIVQFIETKVKSC